MYDILYGEFLKYISGHVCDKQIVFISLTHMWCLTIEWWRFFKKLF